MKFSAIPQFTRVGHYQVNTSWRYLEKTIDDYANGFNLQLNPDFQRGHVWTKEQQIAYVEFILRGGKSARTIYFNCPNWHYRYINNINGDTLVCVDGLQRITAALAFLRNEIPAFGHYHNEYEDKLPINIDFLFNVNDLKTKEEVLQWYIEMNSGGTPHTTKEIERVKKLLEEERNKRLSNKDSVNNET